MSPLHLHARSIVYFDMIRRAGSIRASARHLHVTASAVNRQLLQLEEEVGTPLFERLSSGLRLTAAGEAFARHVITVLQDAQRLAAELDALKGLRRGQVRIVASSGLMAEWMPPLVARMRTDFPMVDLTIDPGGSTQAARAVVDGEADVAIGFSFERRVGLRQVAVAQLAIGAIVSPAHELARQAAGDARAEPAAAASTSSRGAPAGTVTFADCARHPLILPTAELMTHAALAPMLRDFKRPIRTALHTGSISLTKALAAAGHGVAFQTRIGMERELAEGSLVHLPLRVPGRLQSEIGVYVRAGRSLPPAVDAFVRFAVEAIEPPAGTKAAAR